jgi:hypothetical protein
MKNYLPTLLFICIYCSELGAENLEPKNEKATDKLLEAVTQTQCLVSEVQCLVEQLLYSSIACFDCERNCSNV